MSNINNTTKVHFSPDQDYIWNIKGLEQWDKCQKLEISGLDISDEIVEVHFSLEEFQGSAKRMVGTVVDGVIHTDIPVFVLEGPEHIYGNSDVYSAYAWIYLSDEESAETIRKMEFEIKARPKPEDYVKPDELSFLQQLEQAMKNKLDKSGYTPNKFLGTDTEGNVVEKEAPEGGGAVTDEQVAEAVEEYLTENPIEVEVPTKVSELKNDANYVTDEVFKPTKQKADEALIVAKGAQRAFVYDDYEEMQTSGDLLSKATSIIGKNVLIRRLNVPDLWISGVLDPDSHYPYEDIYSDEEILDELEHNGYIAIGYCMLSRLETQKVYLDEYLRKDEIDLDYFATKDDLDNIYIPGSTSELDNDSGFITSDDVPTKTSDLINDSFIESPTTAEVGQMLVVKAVDENGVPTEWEVSDVASGGSGTTDYTDLENKPQINGIELTGNKTNTDLGIGTPTDEQVANAVESYLDEHPEATTTVQDKSITEEKLSDEVIQKIDGNGIFKGKTASFYGDSLTERNYHYTKGYHSWIEDILELTSYNNYGVSGYTVADVYNRINSINDTSDVIFIMCGVNDVIKKIPLGAIGDKTASTTYGSFDLLCSLVKSKYPTTLVIFITPHQTALEGRDGITSYEVARAMREVCEKYAIPVYDNYTYCGLYPTNLSYWTADGDCHWNDKAHEMVGKNLAHYVMEHFNYLYGENIIVPDVPTEVTLTSISATYSGGNVVVGTSVNDLTGITVKATYSDGSTNNVTGYTLSGTIAEGNNVITVSYQGKTTTFTVVGYVEQEEPDTPTKELSDITADFNQAGATIYETDSLTTLKQYLTVTANYSDGTSVEVNDYTLSGSLTIGTSVITVSYEGKVDTFEVVVTEEGDVVKTMEITGVETSSGFHVTLYVSATDLPVLNEDVTIGYDIQPVSNFNVPESTSGGGFYSFDEVNNLTAGYTNVCSVSPKPITNNQDGTYTFTYEVDISANKVPRNYFGFCTLIRDLKVGSKFTITNPYFKVGGRKVRICAIGGAFIKETCIITDELSE